MRRAPVINRKASAKAFASRSSKTHPVNIATALRGGIRL